MKLSSLQLEAFHVLGQTLNFSRAAEKLHITQSAFSQRIMNLESELDTTLVIRDRTQIQLTEAGAKLLRHCEINQAMEVELLHSLMPSKSGVLTGMVRVGGFSSITRSLIVPALAPLLRESPGLSAQVQSVELYELWGLLKSARTDVILTDRTSPSPGIRSELLGYEHNVLVESKRHPQLEVYLDHDERDVTTSSYFNLLKRRPSASLMRYFDDVYGLIDGVKLGLGKAVLPLHLIEGEKELKILHPEIRLSVPLYLTYYEQPFYTRLQSQLLEALRSGLKTRLAAR